MSETASNLTGDIQNPPLNGERPFLKKVGSPAGRPPLDSYLEPEETEEIAVTAERIQENYPFFGTLLKQENGIYRRKEVISRHSPQTIEQVEQRYGAGKYQVRLKKESGGEESIHFSIHEPQKNAAQTQTPSTPGDAHFMESIRRDVREEVRQDFQQIIETLERRLKAKDGELDDLTGKARRLTMELAETERKSNSLVRNETSTHQNKIEQLKEEITELRFENFELQQELKYADVDTGFDIKEVLNDALKNPELYKMLSPLIAKFQPQQPAALAGPAASEPEPTEDKPPKNETYSDKQQNMQHILNQFFATTVQTVSSAMVNGTPAPDEIQKTIQNGLRTLQSNGMKAEPGLWIQISKKLIDVALQNSVSAQKAAETIAPVLEQVNGAADQLKYITPSMATEYIINRFGIEVTDTQKQFLTEVLSVFKNQLKHQNKTETKP